MWGISFNAVQRKCTFKDENKIVLQRIVNRTDEMLDFSDEMQKSMKLKFAEENQGSNNITGSFMRRFRPLNRGLLLIYGVADAKAIQNTHLAILMINPTMVLQLVFLQISQDRG